MLASRGLSTGSGDVVPWEVCSSGHRAMSLSLDGTPARSDGIHDSAWAVLWRPPRHRRMQQWQRNSLGSCNTSLYSLLASNTPACCCTLPCRRTSSVAPPDAWRWDTCNVGTRRTRTHDRRSRRHRRCVGVLASGRRTTTCPFSGWSIRPPRTIGRRRYHPARRSSSHTRRTRTIAAAGSCWVEGATCSGGCRIPRRWSSVDNRLMRIACHRQRQDQRTSLAATLGRWHSSCCCAGRISLPTSMLCLFRHDHRQQTGSHLVTIDRANVSACISW